MLKGDVCVRELKRRGIWQHFVVPPIFKFAWRLGISISPPFYWSEPARLLFLGIPVALVTFAIMLALDVFVRENVLEPWVYGAVSGLVGMSSWSAYSAMVRLHRRKLSNMPGWERLK